MTCHRGTFTTLIFHQISALLFVIFFQTNKINAEPYKPSLLCELKSNYFPCTSLFTHCWNSENSNVCNNILPSFFPFNAEFQHDYYFHSLRQFNEDLNYFSKQRRRKALENAQKSAKSLESERMNIKNTHRLFRHSYLLIVSHPWDPILENYFS